MSRWPATARWPAKAGSKTLPLRSSDRGDRLSHRSRGATGARAHPRARSRCGATASSRQPATRARPARSHPYLGAGFEFLPRDETGAEYPAQHPLLQSRGRVELRHSGRRRAERRRSAAARHGDRSRPLRRGRRYRGARALHQRAAGGAELRRRTNEPSRRANRGGLAVEQLR